MKEEEKRGILEPLRRRYRRARKREKGEILSTVEELMRVGRRQARRLMGIEPPGRPKKGLKRGRKSEYRDAEFCLALKELWRTMRSMSSKQMCEGRADWLPGLERRRRGGSFSEDIRRRLLKISPATIDRVLQPYKAMKGKSTTVKGGFRDEIPIQKSIWNQTVPGFLESDTVAHCGTSLLGEYIYTLTMVDIATLWTECRPSFGKGSTPIVRNIEDIENFLPFEILGYDCDNGTEVLNQHVLRYFQDERVEKGKKVVAITRSREYHSNDNAHVEQGNDCVARGYLGYDRLGSRELEPLIFYYYKYVVCPMQNHFFPSFKLQDKIRVHSKTRRVYGKPKTPYKRVIESPHVSENDKNMLIELHPGLIDNLLKILVKAGSKKRIGPGGTEERARR